MRVIFFGTAEFAVPSLQALIEARHTVALCVTRPDRPQGRGLSPQPSPVKQAALRLGVPLAQPERLQRGAVNAMDADIGVVAAYGALIPAELIARPRHGMLGVHPSLLPRYRGAAPVAWALLNGEATTGVTIFRLTEALDAGAIVVQRDAAIQSGDTTETLTARLAQLGVRELVRALALIDEGRAVFTPQDASRVSLAPKLTKAQGRIEWQASAEAIERLIRATAPWPGASTTYRGHPLKIAAARVLAGPSDAPAGVPGMVVRIAAESITIETGRGLLELTELQPSDRRRMTVREFLAGHPVKPGEKFGE